LPPKWNGGCVRLRNGGPDQPIRKRAARPPEREVLMSLVMRVALAGLIVAAVTALAALSLSV